MIIELNIITVSTNPMRSIVLQYSEAQYTGYPGKTRDFIIKHHIARDRNESSRIQFMAL
jgi:hypothetical protein